MTLRDGKHALTPGAACGIGIAFAVPIDAPKKDSATKGETMPFARMISCHRPTMWMATNG